MFLFSYESEVYSDWTQGVDEVAKANLDKPLIVRDPETLSISVNFDPKVGLVMSVFSNYFLFYLELSNRKTKHLGHSISLLHFCMIHTVVPE